MARAFVFMVSTATVLAGVLHIDGKTAEVLKQDFRGQAAVAAGTGGGNQHLAGRICPSGQPVGHVAAQVVGIQIQGQGAAQGRWLLIDFAQHFVRKTLHVVHSCIGPSGRQFGPKNRSYMKKLVKSLSESLKKFTVRSKKPRFRLYFSFFERVKSVRYGRHAQSPL